LQFTQVNLKYQTNFYEQNSITTRGGRQKTHTSLPTRSSERKLLFPERMAPHCSKDAARFITSGGAA